MDHVGQGHCLKRCIRFVVYDSVALDFGPWKTMKMYRLPNAGKNKDFKIELT